jgi:hypothetical protein
MDSALGRQRKFFIILAYRPLSGELRPINSQKIAESTGRFPPEADMARGPSARHCVMASTAIEVTINGNYLNLQAGEVSLRYQFAELG